MTSSKEFTTASLQGNYAFSGTGWGGRSTLASIGLLTFDGRGSLTGLMLQNLPSSQFGERKSIELPISHTYTVDPNGTGTTHLAEGKPAELLFAISKVDLSGGHPIAQEFSFIIQALEPATGSLIVGLATRLPAAGAFTTASLNGTYIGTAIGQGGQTPGAGLGILTYDGNGQFSEINFSNVQAGSFHDRAFVTGTDQGVYTVNANGTGTVANGGLVFVITKAEAIDGVMRALEYAFIVTNLVPANGIHFTGVTKRRSD
jgi:hypothetical protein